MNADKSNKSKQIVLLKVELNSLKKLKKKLSDVLPFTEYTRTIARDLVYTIESLDGIIENLQHELIN